MQCEKPCGKVMYTAESTAQLACIKAALKGDPGLSWYYSRKCKCWHLTNTKRRGSTGKRVKWVESFGQQAHAA